MFLMMMILVASSILNRIPLAALAALLVFIGIELAAPAKFLAIIQTGRAEFVVFLTTVLVTLVTDLLLGVAAGVVMQWVVSFRLISGNLFRVLCRRHEDDGVVVLSVTGPLVFSNWLSLRARLSREAVGVVLDVSETSLIDHSVMRKLEETRMAWEADGKQLRAIGFEALRACSDNPLATRVRADAFRTVSSVRTDA
jgi:MFS superfamily sulfate permease-like transporter